MELDKATYDRQNGILKTVAEHLKSQGGRAVNEKGNCSYRAQDGKKCAVGVLIKDEFYNPMSELATLMRHVEKDYLEGGEASREQNKRADALDESLLKSGVLLADFPLLDALQSVHDCSGPDYSHEDWWTYVQRNLIRLANDKGLDPRVIPE